MLRINPSMRDEIHDALTAYDKLQANATLANMTNEQFELVCGGARLKGLLQAILEIDASTKSAGFEVTLSDSNRPPRLNR